MKPKHKIGKLLKQMRATLSVAESCTGGLLAKLITDVAGSSAYFLAGVVAYSNAAKSYLLDVEPGLIRRHGAVSAPVACAMAAGVKKLAGSDYAVSITGIAGPAGGTPEKPVGLVYIGIASSEEDITVKSFTFKGTRAQVRKLAAEKALELLLEELQN